MAHFLGTYSLHTIFFMIWIFGIGGFLFFWFVFPGFRILSLVILSIIILGSIGIYMHGSYQELVSKSLIRISQIELNNLRLSNTKYSSRELTAEIKNNSAYTLSELDLKLTAYDCPEMSITPTCNIVGEDDVMIWMSIPPKQVRAIKESVYLGSMPTIKGNFLWSYGITEIKGR